MENSPDMLLQAVRINLEYKDEVTALEHWYQVGKLGTSGLRRDRRAREHADIRIDSAFSTRWRRPLRHRQHCLTRRPMRDTCLQLGLMLKFVTSVAGGDRCECARAQAFTQQPRINTLLGNRKLARLRVDAPRLCTWRPSQSSASAWKASMGWHLKCVLLSRLHEGPTLPVTRGPPSLSLLSKKRAIPVTRGPPSERRGPPPQQAQKGRRP